MKNLNRLIFPLLTLALVLTPVTALSETWDQKLDLTIPSLEMPSTLQLDSKAKQEIMMGWTCCYHPSLVKQVQKEHLEKSIASQLKARPNQLQFTLTDPITNAQVATFVAFQLADIYPTYKGLQYDCVRELNPIVGERPSVGRMFATKVAILTPAFQYDYENGNLTPRVMNELNFLMALVILNNHQVTNKASKNCLKRS